MYISKTMKIVLISTVSVLAVCLLALGVSFGIEIFDNNSGVIDMGGGGGGKILSARI